MSESLGIGRARQWLQEDPNRVYGSILPLSRDKAGGGLRLALPTAARDLGRGMLDMLEGHMTPEASMALLDVPTGGLMRAAAIGARVPATQLGIFAGVGAKTADKAALETAQRMASEGADPRAIWRDTGWFQGPEGKWRWEIDDSGAAVVPTNPNVAETPLFDTLDHIDLQKAYPQLNDVVVESGSPALRGYKGSYSSGYPDDGIPASMKTGGNRSTTLHETQHGVQDAEGFARGGNSLTLRHGTPAWDLYRERLNAITTPRTLEEYTKEAGFDSIDQARASYDDYVRGLERMKKAGIPANIDRMAQDYAVAEAYRRLAGEAEARAVQKRMDMTPEQRRATFPLDSYDVPLDELIVRGAEVDPEFRRLWLQGKAT